MEAPNYAGLASWQEHNIQVVEEFLGCLFHFERFRAPWRARQLRFFWEACWLRAEAELRKAWFRRRASRIAPETHR